MWRLIFTVLGAIAAPWIAAQTVSEPERPIDFSVVVDGGRCVFIPSMPPLLQKPGAPKAYWSYFWEFGDGSFSREEKPAHVYHQPGDYTVSLDVIAHYDDGKKPKKKKKPIQAGGAALADIGPLPDVFDPAKRQMVALFSYSQPRAEEPITLVLSYRNLGAVTTDGRLHFFFNEKKYPGAHFNFEEIRTFHGETADMSTSQVLPTDNSNEFDWATLTLHPGGGAANILGEMPASTIVQQLLSNARGAYRQERAWRFSALEPGEKCNVFITLNSTAGMLRDTNAMIHLEAIFAPFDPVVAPERFEYEIEIVGSHDPNAIAVSDNLINYRIVGSKQLNYKIQFQNNGEGPASKVEVKVEVPPGLQLSALTPLDWYPKCPICPKPVGNRGCLDTLAMPDGYLFTFRNIYLPGSRQQDVDNRDSTKGFVRYRIESTKEMPKRAFRSRARIVFDKNPAIYTNYTRTRFKVGVSPGIKAGYTLFPDSNNQQYPFLGISISPFKSWRVYPQVELLAGLKGRTESPETYTQHLIQTFPNNGIAVFDSVFADTSKRTRRGLVSFELPVLLRKNFNRWMGMGLGASARLIYESGETEWQTGRTTINWEGMDSSAGFMLVRTLVSSPLETKTQTFKQTRYRFSLFADVTIGSVRAGPNLGIRGGYWLGGTRPQPFLQLSAEMKL